MLLWSGIERYCSLKYGAVNKPGDNLKELSEDPLFCDAVKNTEIRNRNPIYSAKNASPYYLNLKNLYFVVNYYYTLRSNVVHRGKQGNNRFGDLYQSSWELLDIFDYMIDNTFKC